MLTGYKTYIAAIGLIALAIYEATEGKYQEAVTHFLAALAAFGLRTAISSENK